MDFNHINKPDKENNSQIKQLYGVIHTLAFLYAIYLSFKCEKQFHFGSFLVACCCPYVYIIYIFATRNNMCQT